MLGGSHCGPLGLELEEFVIFVVFVVFLFVSSSSCLHSLEPRERMKSRRR